LSFPPASPPPPGFPLAAEPANRKGCAPHVLVNALDPARNTRQVNARGRNEGKTMDQRSPATGPTAGERVEQVVEGAIFASRWLMAPIYLGLIVCLAILIFTFFKELLATLPRVAVLDVDDIILLVLTLVDLSLAGNLVLIIVFSGYENFVSKIDAANGAKDRPEWMGTLDFSGLKIKLIASIVAISGIHLLKVFMDIEKYTDQQLLWFTIIHLSFVFSGVAFAIMDFIEAKTHKL
jgi:uncharacterized protein (TIGR00645 family)